ncbi:MAG: hypothetical protein MI861_22475, partial [Pirellulales bacterium]|nr:hypothetical protein [Pirellulales bacterium]
DSPEVAQQVAATYCDVFLDEHVRLHHTQTSLDFFRQQTEHLADELAAAEARLRDTKNEFALASIEGRRQALEKQIGKVQEDRQSNRVAVASAESRLKLIGEQIDATPATIVAETRTGVANAATDGMRQQLYNLEIEERRIKQQYNDVHPKVVAIRAQLADVRRILEQQERDRTEETVAVNEEHRLLNLSLKEEAAKLAALQGGQQALQIQTEQLLNEMRDLNGHEAVMAKLQRDVDELRRNHQIHSERLEQARVDGALASNSISNIRLVQPATYQQRPASPRFGLTLVLGLVFALSAGIASSLWGLFAEATVKSAETVARQAHTASPPPADQQAEPDSAPHEAEPQELAGQYAVSHPR